VNLEPDAYAEIVRRLVSLRATVAELSAAYDDPVAKEGAQEMHESIDRVLQLLGHEK
jgi:hypothetical protein